MKTVVPGVAKRQLRLSCGQCECLFDITRRDVKKTTVKYQFHSDVEQYVKCPGCGDAVYFAW